jgi:hypothetical protein
MISESQASLFHWRFAGGKLELARGHWIISRVYSTLSMPESAIYHGKKVLTSAWNTICMISIQDLHVKHWRGLIFTKRPCSTSEIS